MIAVNATILLWKLRIGPLQYLRREISGRKQKRALRLSRKIPFAWRFRIRILLQNLPNYITMSVGIVLAGAIIIFGLMFEPFDALKYDTLLLPFADTVGFLMQESHPLAGKKHIRQTDLEGVPLIVPRHPFHVTGLLPAVLQTKITPRSIPGYPPDKHLSRRVPVS